MASLKDSVRTTRVGDIGAALTSTSRLIVYTGSPPSKTATPSGTPLATFTLAATPGTASAGAYTFTAPSNVTGAAGGVPGYFRMIDGTTDDGTHTVVQGTAAVGSGELNFASSIASGGTVSISSFVITEGNN